MTNWTTLKEAIANVIKTNDNQEITGTVLQNTLNSIVNSVGENATFAGVATPSTNPGSPDGPVFYFAFEPGDYYNFGHTFIDETSNVKIFLWKNSKWDIIDTGLPNNTKVLELINEISNSLLSEVNKISNATVELVDKKIEKLSEKVDTQKHEVDAARDKAIENINAEEQSALANFSAQRVTPEMLSESTLQLINSSGGGSIVNMADDEDLYSTGKDISVLKFKDKKYLPSNFSGLGKVYLRKNVTGDKNILEQSMLSFPNTIYIIQYNYDLNNKTINIPEGCILDFHGGSLSNGTLNGNNTHISSPLYHIFKNIILSGFFSNAEGYVEWFGAKAYPKPVIYDCAPYIDNAFDSPFGTIVFQNGCYYLASTITLKRVKTILMNGRGSRRLNPAVSTNMYSVNNQTCLWVNSNIDIFEVNLNGDDFIKDRHDNIRLIIKGGCLNASMASEQGDKVYNKTALLIKLPVWGMINSEINTSMVRSAYYGGALENSSIDDRGNGVWFTDNGKLIEAEGVERKGSNYIQDITVDCIGFTHGVLVDYNPAYGDMTHLMIHGYFGSCVKDIYINSYAISYGLIDATIQSSGIFRKGEDVNKYPHISGNLNRCKIDSIFWDINNEYHSPIAIDATRTSNLILGDRARSTLNNNNIIGGGAFYHSLYQKAIHPLLDANRLGFVNTSARDNYLKLIDNSLLDVAKRKTVEISIDSNLDILNKDNLDVSSLFSNFLVINLNSPQSSEDAYLIMKITFSTTEQMVGLYLHTNLNKDVTHFNNISVEVYNESDELISSNYDSAFKDRDLPGLSDFIIPTFIEGYSNERQVKYIIIKMRGLVVSSQDFVRLSLEGGAQGVHSHMITSLGGTIYEDLDLRKMLLQGHRVNYDSDKSSLTIGDTIFVNESPLNRQFLQKTNTEGTSHIKLFNVPRQFFGTFIITMSAALSNNACYVVMVYKGYNDVPVYAVKELYRGIRYDFATFKSTEPVVNGDNSLVISTISNTIVSRVYVADYINSYYKFGDLEFIDDSTWESLPNTVKISKYTTLNTTTTKERPTYADTGVQYFDTTINKPIWWTGSKWVDSTGADV